MQVDVAIVGAGAAGLHCAAMAGQLGLQVLLIDHAEKVAEKIRISGGGRCNFTNIDVGPENFDSANPDFCRSALARYTPRDFIELVERHRIGWHEKHKGQLFCDDSSNAIIAMLLAECAAGGVQRWQPCRVDGVRRGTSGFTLDTSRGELAAGRLVVATGGLSIPKIGATDWGYALARRLGHRIVETRPALAPFVCTDAEWQRFAALAGLSLPVRIAAGSGAARAEFIDDLLFTHRGLSGPAALQISTYWRPGESIVVDLAPEAPLARALLDAKQSRRSVGAVLADLLPRRLAEAWLAPSDPSTPTPARRRRLTRPRSDLRRPGRGSSSLVRGAGQHRGATARPRSRPAASTRASSTRAAAKAALCPGFISSARSSTSPAGWAATTSSGRGPARPPAPGRWR